jgi:2-oxoglutarate ferredoxin oxidoreductase subunit beta
MKVIAKRPDSLTKKEFHYCPGCTHGITHRLIAEVIDELGIKGTTIGVSPVGCSYNAYEYFDMDIAQAAHGRAPAVATGIKRVHPDKTVFTYQGDGDLAAIGTAEIVHAAARSENFTTIFINNAIYGMTSGQMAPTTLIGQVTTTSPYGRDPKLQGYPLKVCEMISSIDGPVYVERVSMHNILHIKKAKKAIKKAFTIQLNGQGFSLVEVLSTCPTNWGISPAESLDWIKDKMIPVYKLGVFKDLTEEEK